MLPPTDRPVLDRYLADGYTFHTLSTLIDQYGTPT
jgi:hypothetical protein